ncbi:hypothetical protein [Nonomuraea glycinis]|uniref:hypothetical protein n=1 Tax=Nonomuraea glycinis TaxID=2047744 RepID=UPI0033BE7798
MEEWEPYIEYGTLRVRETSCCGEYEWCCEGGLFLVLRRNVDDYEATDRGHYAQVRPIWEALIRNHRHTSRG